MSETDLRTQTHKTRKTYTMTRYTASLLLAAMIASTNAFTPITPRSQNVRKVPYFINVVEDSSIAEEPSEAVKPKPTPKAKGPVHKEGPLSPVVVLAKKVLGDTELNKLRGKVIGLHSDVIKSFVDTASSPFGEQVLTTMFELADLNKNGKIDVEELSASLRALGFDLKDNQIQGIFDRADLDANGDIDIEEFRKEAPKTLRTNLVKLAKRNGGDLGFLS
jgi:hypothetical protein